MAWRTREAESTILFSVPDTGGGGGGGGGGGEGGWWCPDTPSDPMMKKLSIHVSILLTNAINNIPRDIAYHPDGKQSVHSPHSVSILSYFSKKAKGYYVMS